MKLKSLLLAFIALIPTLSFGQAALTIFSEDGDKFFLVLNGQQQNAVAQTNVHIDGLMQPYYKVKVVFENKALEEIGKNIPVNDPSTNTPADVTYKIKKTNKGEMKIRYFSATPMQTAYQAPPNVYVMHYSDAGPATSVTQTTTTTTTAGGQDASLNMNGGNVNLNVNMSNPNMVANTTVTQTTTTRTSSSGYSDGGNTNYQQQPATTGCQYPMAGHSFNDAKKSIADASFEETKLSTAKAIAGGNCFSSQQVLEICKLFSFESSKLDFAKFAYSKTVDQNNYFKVNTIFDFDASKTELNNYISGGR